MSSIELSQQALEGARAEGSQHKLGTAELLRQSLGQLDRAVAVDLRQDDDERGPLDETLQLPGPAPA
jgi:hypothetical protein